jgi:hypothetical protein
MRNQKIKNPKGKIFQGGAKIEGKYANYFKVGYNAFEFLFDFGQQYSETEEGKLYTRIVTSPCYAKSLLKTLRDSIEQYEKNFGSIKAE